MSAGNVLSLFSLPTEKDCARVVSIALLQVRATGRKPDEIAKQIGCHPKTVENASNERTMLSFPLIALLMARYPEVIPIISSLWSDAAAATPSADERFDRIERHLAAIRQELNP